MQGMTIVTARWHVAKGPMDHKDLECSGEHCHTLPPNEREGSPAFGVLETMEMTPRLEACSSMCQCKREPTECQEGREDLLKPREFNLAEWIMH